MNETTKRRPRASKEAVLTDAVDVAREALAGLVDEVYVGEHEGARLEGERLLTHYFASLQPGYRGWRWAVTVARPPRGRSASVCEVALLPGDDALVAPAWVPWAERLAPGDVGPADVLPYEEADVRLVPGFTDTSENADQLEIDEPGLGRVRVLSPEGFRQAAERWYEGDHGPTSPAAKAATSQCSTCGFFMKMAGTPRTLFGVCSNVWSPDDGRVVSVDHGCGAHSETDVAARPPLWRAPEMVLDEGELIQVELDSSARSAVSSDAGRDEEPKTGGAGRAADAIEEA